MAFKEVSREASPDVPVDLAADAPIQGSALRATEAAPGLSRHVELERWETSTRYYETRRYCDLLGDSVLSVAYGGRGNRLGQFRVVATGADVEPALAAVRRARSSHGYAHVRLSATEAIAASTA